MKGLVLASGKGSRLGERRGRPKPLVPVAGVPLLERAITTLHRAGVSEVVVSTGYRGDEVERFCERVSAERGIPVRCVRNERYEEGNGLSVLAAEAALGEEDFILVMADHVLDPEIAEALAATEPPAGGATLAVDHDVTDRRDVDLDDVTRVSTEGGLVRSIGKHLEPYDGFDTGAFRCTHGVFDALAAAVLEGDSSLSAGMQRLADEGRLEALPVSGSRWDDVDTPRDHRRTSRRLYRRLGKARDGMVAARLNRHLSQRVVTPGLLWLAPGITANQVTLIAFTVALAAAAALALGAPLLGAVLVQLSSVLDGSDGEVARLKGTGSRYGGYLDASLDRVADGAILIAATVFLLYAPALSWVPAGAVVAVVGAALVGHLMVSYTSAKGAVDLDHDYGGALLASGRGRDLRLLLVTIAAAVAQWWAPALLVVAAVIAVLTWGIVVERMRRSWVVETRPWADVDAVVLDFDGTIADSMEALAELAVDLLTRGLGLEPAAARSAYLATSGLDFRSQLEEIAPGDPRLDRIDDAFEQAKVDLMERVGTFADIDAFLAELAAAEVPVAVCSSSQAEAVRSWLARHDLVHRFAHVDGYRPGWPKAKQLAATVQLLGLRPDRVLFVGDSTRDANIARMCGTGFRGVNRPSTSTFAGSGIGYEPDLTSIARTIRVVKRTNITVGKPSPPRPVVDVARVVRPDEPAGAVLADLDRGQRAVGHLDSSVGLGPGAHRPRHRGTHDRIVREPDDRSLN